MFKNYKKYIKAAEEGDLNKLKEYLSMGYDINYKDKMDYDALRIAVFYNYKNIIEYLVEQGAELNEYSFDSQTPVYLAIHHEELDTLRYLIKKGGDLYCRNGMFSGLHYAAYVGAFNAIEYIVNELGVDVNLLQENGATPLIYACQENKPKAVKTLIKLGAVIDCYNDISAVYQAASDNHIEVLKILLEYNAFVDYKEYNPLIIAASCNSMECIKELVRYGVDVNIKDEDGRNALFWALTHNNLDAAEILINNNSDSAIIDKFGYELDDLKNEKIRYKIINNIGEK